MPATTDRMTTATGTTYRVQKLASHNVDTFPQPWEAVGPAFAYASAAVTELRRREAIRDGSEYRLTANGVPCDVHGVPFV